MREELQPGQQMVVGELAGLTNARKYGSSIKEFYAGLPDDVVCNAGVFAQHAYAQRGDAADDAGAVGALENVLDKRPCAHDKPIWVTETGVGGPHVGDERSPSAKATRADCQALNVALRRWNDDPRVDAAFQYTFRDDPVFPVGLVDARLTHTWPAYDLLKAWGGDRKPDGPAPRCPRPATRERHLRRAPLAGPLRTRAARRDRARSPQRPGHVRRHRAQVSRRRRHPLPRRGADARQVDELSGAYAAALTERSVGRGDRVALYLQSVPEFVVVVLAAWKLGAIAVPVNPMLKEREVRTLVEDCEPGGLQSASHDLAEWAQLAHAQRRPGSARSGPRPGRRRLPDLHLGHDRAAEGRHEHPRQRRLQFADVPRVGRPDADDVILGVAPLFHITGLIAHLGTTLLTGASLVLAYRFDAEAALELIERHGVDLHDRRHHRLHRDDERQRGERRHLDAAHDRQRRRADPARDASRRSRSASASTSTTSTG